SAVRALSAQQPHLVLTKLAADAQNAMLKHQLTVEQTKSFLGDAKAQAETAGFTSLAQLIEQSMASKLPASDAAMPLMRLHDNPYGRVFESKLIAEVVAASPQKVGEAMTAMARYTADFLDKAPADGGLKPKGI